MHSSSKIISHVINGTREIFVLNTISVINLYEDDLYSINKLELILSYQKGITLLYLHTTDSSFKLETNITSNANLAIISDATGFIISNKTKLEAEQLFITNYFIDEEQFLKTNDIHIVPSSSDRYIINSGYMFTRNNQKSGIASDKFVNRGRISDNIDCKTHIGLKQGQLTSSGSYDKPSAETPLLGHWFNFIFGDYYE